MQVFIHEYVTGGGMADATAPASLKREATLMRRALATDFAAVPGVSVVMTLDARSPDEPGPWTVVRVGPGEEIDVFHELALRADHTLVVAPETGGLLEERARWIRDAVGRSLGSEPAAIALTADKLALFRVLVNRDVRTPATRAWSRLEGLPKAFRYPAVLKPIDGAGCMDTLIVASNEDEPDDARFPHRSGVLQPYRRGSAMSACFLVCERRGKRLVAVCDQIVEAVDGRLHYLGGRLVGQIDRADGHVRRAIDAAPGLRGFVGVDFLWDDDDQAATVLEINPRPTTSICAVIKRLGPGFLARAWLEAVAPNGPDLSGLRAMVRPTEPIPFGLDDDSLEFSYE